MDINFTPSLQHLSSVKIASLLLLDYDIGKMLDRDLMMPYCFDHFEPARHHLWEMIKRTVIKKVHPLAPSLQLKVAEYLRAMHLEFVIWLRDHDLSPQRKGFHINYTNLICWKFDGTIDREQTAKKYVQNGSIDARDRFIMACNYCFIDVMVDLWGLIKIVGLPSTSRRGINSAVRLWMCMLKKGITEPTKEMIEAYLKVQSLSSSDIPIRLSSYFRFLCRKCRRDYFIMVDPITIHNDDFRSCLYQMEETERIELLELTPGNVLIRLLEWPFQSVFIKVAIEISSKLRLREFETILEYMVGFYILNGYNFLEIFVEFWSLIPDCQKDEIKKDKKKFKAYEAILNYGTVNQSKSLAETVSGYYFS
ncbi:hypothetical protein AVEN_235492-1 [Araneus ventricosus]|uniref:Uncharacterized protein n=1 Tax=Araneus ventricosus TaxID=182803 RepID=A0A4Y2A405_ARAVE|nr:hypothetical protein AVEN_235492-1 [Araneus ventricosus]